MRAILVFVCTAVLASPLGAMRQTIEAAAQGEAKLTETNELILRGALEGDLRGTLQVTLRWETTSRARGHWSLTTFADSADGAPVETGTIRGDVVDGAFVAGPAGAITSISDLKLTVSAGSGEYATVSDGSGRLDVQLGRDVEPFRGTLSVTF